jgi:predicted nuclease of predicted toxin-antitoxin system
VKIKLDENIGMRGSELLAGRAHDVSTVRDQKLSGASDESIFAVCAAEGRVLISAKSFAFRQNRALASSFWTLAREQVRRDCLTASEIF